MISALNTENTALMLISSAAALNFSTSVVAGSEEMTGAGEGTSQDFDDRVQISAAAMKLQGR